MLKKELMLYGAVGAGALVLLYIASRNSGAVAGVVAGVANTVAQTTVAAADAAVGGIVQGTGSVFGIPNTDPTLCEIACANGKTFEASKYCDAGRFVSYLVHGK